MGQRSAAIDDVAGATAFSGAVRVGRADVGVEPLARCVLQTFPVLLSWLVVVRAGRAVCLVAQRLPPVVLAVRALQSRASTRRVAREAALAPPTDGHTRSG